MLVHSVGIQYFLDFKLITTISLITICHIQRYNNLILIFLCLFFFFSGVKKSESVEAANKILEEMQKKNGQIMQEKEKSCHEHMKQLAEKMEKERAQLMAEQGRVLMLKFQVFDCVISILC